MAYGDNRSEVAADTFNSSIGAAWTNPHGGHSACAWATGGFVQPTVTGGVNNQMRRNTGTYDDNQYSRVTIQATDTNSILGPAVRCQTGAGDGSSYNGVADAVVNNEWAIYEVDAGETATRLAGSTTGYAFPTAGAILTTEAEGSTLRFGEDSGGDQQRVTTTDATLSGGIPGVTLAAITTVANSRITAWSGGSISAPTITGSGTPQSQSASAEGVGERIVPGTGSFSSQNSNISGSGSTQAEITGSGTLIDDAAEIVGAGYRALLGLGTPTSQDAQASGSGVRGAVGAGTPSSLSATVFGSGNAGNIKTGSGVLLASEATFDGAGVITVLGVGAMAPVPSSMAGVGTRVITGTSALQAIDASLDGSGFKAVFGLGSLSVQSATVSGVGDSGFIRTTINQTISITIDDGNSVFNISFNGNSSSTV